MQVREEKKEILMVIKILACEERKSLRKPEASSEEINWDKSE